MLNDATVAVLVSRAGVGFVLRDHHKGALHTRASTLPAFTLEYRLQLRVRLTTPTSQPLFHSYGPQTRIVGICLILTVSTGTHALLSRSVDVETIVRRWLQVSHTDFDAALAFGYCERVRDDDGTKTYEVILLDGSPFKRLVGVDDRPLAEDAAEKERQRFEHAKTKRADESPDDTAERIADYRKDFERAHRILEQMPHAFQYTLQGTQQTGVYTAYVLVAVPKENYDPPSTETEVLTGMRARFWIDTKSYQMIRAVARVLKPVTIEGFLATVQPGTEFEVEQKRVAPDVWLPTHLQIRSHSHILFFFHHHIHEDRIFFDYRRESAARDRRQACVTNQRIA
jgi:hypothetical protein